MKCRVFFRYLSVTYMNLGYAVFEKIKLRIVFENETEFLEGLPLDAIIQCLSS